MEWNCGNCQKKHIAVKAEFSNDLHQKFRETMARRILGGKVVMIFTETLNLNQEGITFIAEDGANINFNMKFFIHALKQGPPEMALKVTKRWLVNVDEKMSE